MFSLGDFVFGGRVLMVVNTPHGVEYTVWTGWNATEKVLVK